MDLPKTKKEAVELNETYYYTGKECKNGHTSKRFAHNGSCYDCVQDAGKKWYEKNSEDFEWQKKRMFNALKNKAKRLGKEFTLKFEELVWPTYCPILGIKLEYGGNRTLDKYNSFSFDRVDNMKGYTKENVQIISMKANSMKSDATIEELKKIIDYMENHK